MAKTSTTVLVVTGLWMTGFGLHEGPLGCIGGVVCLVFGVVLGLAFGREASLIRFRYDDDDVTVTWLRGTKELRTERVKRADLVDVAIDDTPSSGGSCYRLVLGTRLGDLVFSESYTSDFSHYAGCAERLRAVFGIPLR